MFRKRLNVILFVGIALLSAALACGPNIPNLGDSPAEDNAPSDSSSSSGEASSEEDNVPLDYQGVDVSGLSTYRAKFSMTFDGTDASGNPVNGSYILEEAFSANPPVSLVVWSMEGTDLGHMEMTQIEDVTYMVSSDASGGQQCITFSEEGTAPEPSGLISPDMYLTGSDLSDAKRIRPNEMVNGVMTRHYRVTEAEAILSGMSNYVADIWVAVDGNHIVRQTMAADGKLLGTGANEGHVEWTYDLLDINGQVDIQVPVDCDEAVTGLNFPQMPDAADVGSFGLMLSYTTASSVAEVVDFYRGELPPLGWAESSITELEGLATIEFTRGEEKATITISESDGVTNVLIMFE